MLIHQLPPEPAYLRVKIRRRLLRLGAAALKNTVYTLPETDENLEHFQWLANEIEAEGGEATICLATIVDRGGVSAPKKTKPRGATWVTRKDVFVDRIASAWLIRRYIDPRAKFKFVAASGYKAKPGELRFDMYQGEFGHEGDRCTFETLLRHFALRGKGLQRIAEIVHDIDLKDEKFGREEAAGIAAVFRGIRASSKDDHERLARGGQLLDEMVD